MRCNLKWLGLIPVTLLGWSAPGLAVEQARLQTRFEPPKVFLPGTKPTREKTLPFESPRKASSSFNKQNTEGGEILLQVEEALTEDDQALSDGSRYDEYVFAGKAGQIIKIRLESDVFDPFLLLEGATGERIAENDDVGGNTNAEIVVRLSETGRYRILANSFDATGRGSYRLTTSLVTAAELRQADLRNNADQLLGQGNQQAQVSQFRAALQSYQAALEIYREIGDRQGEVNTLDGIGYAYSSLAAYSQALSYYQQAITISRTIGDRTNEGNILNNIGNVYGSLGDYPQALDYYHKALAISRTIGDRVNEGNILGNIGIVYRLLESRSSIRG